MIYFVKAEIYINGTVHASYNNATSLFLLESCSVVINGKLYFLANICKDQLIGLVSGTKYIIMEEYSVIEFDDNILSKLVLIHDYHDNNINNNIYSYEPNPFCLFQYVTTNSTFKIPPPTDHYKIIINTVGYLYGVAQSIIDSIKYHTSHCRWIQSAAYYGYRSGPVNEKIIIADYFNQNKAHNHLCMCSSDGSYNCSADEIGPVYPGQVVRANILLPHAHEMHVVYAETLEDSLSQSGCKVSHQYELINTLDGDCKMLNFTIVSNATKECELFFKLRLSMYFYYEAFYVKLLKCPEGFSLINGVCDCDPILANSDLHIENCDIEKVAIKRPPNSWIFSGTSNVTKYLLSTPCPMDYCLPHSSALNLSNPDLQCQSNRSGILCSQCQHGLSNVFGSSRCMKCTNVYILITLIVIVAGIVLVVLLYLLNLTVTNGTINGIILYANIVSINDSVFLVNDIVIKPLKVFISFINLDLGIETCYYNGMDSYAKMWLQLFFPLYLILIATFIIIASRYSYRIQRITFARSLPVLATLFLLSYTGILRVVSTVLFSYSTIIELPSGHKELVWSIDASVPLFGVKFTILFITCLVLFLLLIPFNFILMFTRSLSQFKMINHFKPLLDALHGSHSDKHYYWIAVHIVTRNLLLALHAVNSGIQLAISAMFLVVFGAAYGYIQPYKSRYVNVQELMLLVNLTILYGVAVCYHNYNDNAIFSKTANVMITTTLLHFSAIVLYHFLTYTS